MHCHYASCIIRNNRLNSIAAEEKQIPRVLWGAEETAVACGEATAVSFLDYLIKIIFFESTNPSVSIL